MLDSLPTDLTTPNGVTHRLWIDDDSRVIRVEGETIDREDAQRRVDAIIAENLVEDD